MSKEEFLEILSRQQRNGLHPPDVPLTCYPHPPE